MKKTINSLWHHNQRRSESNMLDSMTNLLRIFSQCTWVGKGWHKHSHISFNVHMPWPVMTRCIFWFSLWIAPSEEHGLWLSEIYKFRWPKQRQAIGLAHKLQPSLRLSTSRWSQPKWLKHEETKHAKLIKVAPPTAYPYCEACQSTNLPQKQEGTCLWPWRCLSPKEMQRFVCTKRHLLAQNCNSKFHKAPMFLMLPKQNIHRNFFGHVQSLIWRSKVQANWACRHCNL